jgi:hypothetical protein
MGRWPPNSKSKFPNVVSQNASSRFRASLLVLAGFIGRVPGGHADARWDV